ncbi:MAG: GTP 3',8-cyclase MoaA [Candidatus Methanofastidiosia archaeon]
MKDRYGREVKNLRISVTQRCNLKCIYCHREGEENGEEELTPGEIRKIVEIGTNLGIRKLKLTGGEPLMRKDIAKITKLVSPLVEEVSMTTNGVLLERHALELKKAGLRRVNISLDTLNEKLHQKLTGKRVLGDVLLGIKKALRVGLKPIKLNMVVTKLNYEEIEEMMEFCGKDYILQLIELEAPREEENGKLFKKYYYDLKPYERELERKALQVKEREMHRRRKYFLPTEVEVVRSMHNTEFCMNCTRLRHTSDGKLKPCLMRKDNLVDIITPLRKGASKKELLKLFEKAIYLRVPYWFYER